MKASSCRLFVAILTTILISQALVADEAAKKTSAKRPNVLFIAVDDLNHWVGHLGRNPQTKTPNLDRLAAMGVSFRNAHCAAPVCNPSRAALLSGRRPNVTGIYDNGTSFELAIRSEESLVTHFRNAGYETLGMGKLWHGGLGWPDQWTKQGREKNDDSIRVDDRSIGGIRFGIVEGGDESVSDTKIADFGISELTRKHEHPFFLTLGFHKPHMPWNVPQKYYDLHPLDQIQLPPTSENDLADVPTSGRKMAKPDGDHADVLKSGRWKEAVQAYLAAISYLDAQVGRVLDALEASEHQDSTIICLWGDHGWHLGEKEHWRKFALWEEATRAPFIWVVPGVTKGGGTCDHSVDFMSIYPTLCELSDLPRPEWVEGHSIVQLLKDPQSDWDHVARTTFGKNNHAIRTDRWRFIRYADGSEELYDHQTDPYEWKNLASFTEFAQLREELAKHLPELNVPAPKGKAGTDKLENNDGKPKRTNRKKNE
jgi:arylsulfatase A-like enzyme